MDEETSGAPLAKLTTSFDGIGNQVHLAIGEELEGGVRANLALGGTDMVSKVTGELGEVWGSQHQILPYTNDSAEEEG